MLRFASAANELTELADARNLRVWIKNVTQRPGNNGFFGERSHELPEGFRERLERDLVRGLAEQAALFGIARLNVPRSEIPAITHVDYSARVQTVSAETNPRYHALLKAFESRTGCGVLVNTSFNVRGEPIVCTPEDAYRCFMRTEMDYLVIENFILAKQDQPSWDDDGSWKEEFELD